MRDPAAVAHRARPGRRPVAAEDVVQTVWMSLLHSADNVRDPQTVVKWLLTSARREAWRVSKRTRADMSRSAAIFGVDGEEVHRRSRSSERRSPTRWSSATTGQRRLWDHVQGLPERCRTADPRHRLRRQARLRPPRRVARHAGGQHRPHPGSVPGQAARPARAGPAVGRKRRHDRRRRPGGSARDPRGRPSRPLDATDDRALLAEVQRLYDAADPVPDGPGRADPVLAGARRGVRRGGAT